MTEEPAPALVAGPIPDYVFPGLADHLAIATSIGGLVGSGVVFAIALGLVRSLNVGQSGSTRHAA
jgi:hypothetical protein